MPHNGYDDIVLAVDDGALSNERPDGGGYRLGLECYGRILELARALDLAIPIAVTAGFIDLKGRAGLNLTNPDAETLIDLLATNRRHLPAWNHGLTHWLDGQPTEFLLLNPPGLVCEVVQSRHLELSQAIFEDCGLDRPTVLVPPGHAWEPGKTDRLASSLGIRHIAIREFEKTSVLHWLAHPNSPYLRTWEPSQHLNTYHRLGLGIPYNKRNLTRLDFWKALQYARPSNVLAHSLVHRSRRHPKAPHHFFAHVHNFSGANALEFWIPLVTRLRAILHHQGAPG